MDVVNLTSFAHAQMKTGQNSITPKLLNAQKLQLLGNIKAWGYNEDSYSLLAYSSNFS